jgi:outer membrane receptor protein involved in Fe transport
VDPTTGLYTGATFPIALTADWTLRTRSASIFGQGEHDLGESWTAIVGLRLTHDNKDFLDRDNSALRQCNDPAYPSGYCASDYTPLPYHGSYAQTLYSGKFELQYRPIDKVMVYGSVSRGTKAGGFNNGFISINAQNLNKIPYGAETNIASELGLKSQFLNGRLRLNASVFNYDYKNFQAYNWFNFGGLVVNRDATSRGGELELVALLIPRLEATVGVGALHTKVRDITLPDTVTTVDREMASAPHVSGQAGLKYTVPIGNGGSLVMSWDGNYVSSSYTDLANDPAALVHPYFLHNARISYAPDEHWELAVSMNNVSDRQVAIRPFVFTALGFSQQLYARPRTTLGLLSYKW